MSTFSLSAQIDCVNRQIRLVEQNPNRHRPSAVEFEVSILRSVLDSLHMLDEAERAAARERRAYGGDRS